MGDNYRAPESAVVLRKGISPCGLNDNGAISFRESSEKRNKLKFKSNQQKVVKFMKRKSLRKYQESYYPSPRSAEEISESNPLVLMDTKKVFRGKIKETLYTI